MAMDKWVREILDTLKRLEVKIDRLAGGGSGDVEAQLEAETGKDMVKTGSNPPTYAESDAPAPVGRGRRSSVG